MGEFSNNINLPVTYLIRRKNHSIWEDSTLKMSKSKKSCVYGLVIYCTSKVVNYLKDLGDSP